MEQIKYMLNFGKVVRLGTVLTQYYGVFDTISDASAFIQTEVSTWALIPENITIEDIVVKGDK